MSRTRFAYEPLPESQFIRLLILQPGVDNDPLACMLEEESLQTNPEFEAISYAWGEGKSDIKVGHEDTFVEVPRNLELALARFRLEDKQRVLWADSVCINQDDLPERNSQVKIMGQIYSQASSVLVWLGEEDAETQLARSFVNILGEDPPQRKLTFEDDSPMINGARCMLTRPWFKRAWTYQECVLARAVEEQKQVFLMCGSYLLTAEELSNMALYLSYENPVLRESLELVDANIPSSTASQIITPNFSRRFGNALPRSLLAAISDIRGAGCADPRDLVFSVVGCAPEGRFIQPDYMRSLEDIFSEFAKTVTRTSAKLDILGCVTSHRDSSNKKCDPPLPSWVPDWRNDLEASYNLEDSKLVIDGELLKQYQATGSSDVVLIEPSDPKELSVLGISVDTIETLHGSYESDLESKLSLLRDQYSEIISAKETPPASNQEVGQFRIYPYTGDDLEIAALRVLNLDQSVTDICFPFNIENHIEKCEDANYMLLMDRAIHRKQLGRVLSISKGGRIGSVPEQSKKGDLICLLLGCSVPVVLRPAGDKYTFIGECFVLGLMDGAGLVEARQRADPSYDEEDMSWINELHGEPFPFKTKTFVIQ